VVARFDHRVDASGRATTTVVLPDGTVLGNDLRAVLNRARWLRPPGFARAGPEEASYAVSEVQALVASWLHGLGAARVGAVRGAGLCGPERSTRRWLLAAADAGLPVRGFVAASSARVLGPVRWRDALDEGSPLGDQLGGRRAVERAEPLVGPTTPVLVADGRLVGGDVPWDRGWQVGAQTLAEGVGSRLLGLEVGVRGDGTRCVVGVDLVPPLPEGVQVAAAADVVASVAARLGPVVGASA
jgi:hypothetical protein